MRVPASRLAVSEKLQFLEFQHPSGWRECNSEAGASLLGSLGDYRLVDSVLEGTSSLSAVRCQISARKSRTVCFIHVRVAVRFSAPARSLRGLNFAGLRRGGTVQLLSRREAIYGTS